MLRVGLIGTGNMGADHARTLSGAVSGAAVEVVTDLDADRAAEVAAGLGVRTAAGAQQLIDDERVDAVLIASHDDSHAEYVAACLRAGKPVLCEKPLAPTSAACRDLVRAERAAVGDGVPLVSLGFMRRFDPGYVELRSALAEGLVGRPLRVQCTSRGVSSYPGSTTESAVTNSAVHEFDVLPWLLGSPVTEVSWQRPARAAAGSDTFADPQLILLRTADDVLSSVDLFLNAGYGYDVRCEVLGETGSVGLVQPHRLVVDARRARSVGYPADWRPRFADAYRLELQAWVDAVRAGRAAPLATAADALTASTVADAVIASARDGGAWHPVASMSLPEYSTGPSERSP
jgi:myo-inositol 2-dehydrogenase/D-chiro-inositol 1-dehydrogenase